MAHAPTTEILVADYCMPCENITLAEFDLSPEGFTTLFQYSTACDGCPVHNAVGMYFKGDEQD